MKKTKNKGILTIMILINIILLTYVLLIFPTYEYNERVLKEKFKAKCEELIKQAKASKNQW